MLPPGRTGPPRQEPGARRPRETWRERTGPFFLYGPARFAVAPSTGRGESTTMAWETRFDVSRGCRSTGGGISPGATGPLAMRPRTTADGVAAEPVTSSGNF